MRGRRCGRAVLRTRRRPTAVVVGVSGAVRPRVRARSAPGGTPVVCDARGPVGECGEDRLRRTTMIARRRGFSMCYRPGSGCLLKGQAAGVVESARRGTKTSGNLTHFGDAIWPCEVRNRVKNRPFLLESGCARHGTMSGNLTHFGDVHWLRSIRNRMKNRSFLLENGSGRHGTMSGNFTQPGNARCAG